jgi:ribulose-5-phosphate 4-epimerase/fuculose-1-phosphate aldolase
MEERIRAQDPTEEGETTSPVPLKQRLSTLITANHILHKNEVVDAYGHISARNPENPTTFFLSRSIAPALVSKRADLEEYKVADASPVNAGGPKGYAERFIHSEIYKKYSGVKSVVHCHSEAVIPFGIVSLPLTPVFHMVCCPRFNLCHSRRRFIDLVSREA